MNASMVIMTIGWFFLLVAFIWPTKKWGGYVMKIALSAISSGIFLAGAIYQFMS